MANFRGLLYISVPNPLPMKFRQAAQALLLCLAVFCATDARGRNELRSDSCYESLTSDPFKTYKRARKKDELRKLSVEIRVMILDSAWHQAQNDSSWKLLSPVKRNEMITEVVVTTPLKDIPVLLDSMHTTVNAFGERYSFLPTLLHTKVMDRVALAFKEPERQSSIFTSIPCEAFCDQMRNNIAHQGDNLFQSHSTNFCGKVALTRLWIQKDTNDYKRFMTDLYYNGRAVWNGMEFVTPPEVIEAVNEHKITWDPDQHIQFGEEKMPEGMDMVLYLTLAAAFQTFPFNMVAYDPEEHRENKPWAGAAINPQLKLLRGMGFEADKVGNNIRGVNDEQFEEIKSAAAPGSQKRVVLLVNSSILDTLSGAGKEYTIPRGLEHLLLGTHWITVDEINPKTDTFTFWEYGKHREVKGIEQMKSIIAGGIIVRDYDPK